MTPQQIILHHSLTKDSGTVSWDAIRRYHLSKGWRDIGYHFGIETVEDHCEVLTGRMMNEQGAHTKGCNWRSIGICVVGNFDEMEPPKAKWDLAVKLTRSLCELLRIPEHMVFGHREFASYKTCPGDMFDMAKFREALK